ncbi:hypothetical protein PHSC3_001660 [Chlamydiales bacterium STE3]|nr:hypothetical protein PHSC3_001660 [Chlamydiales bacterium STE3]
MYMAMQLKMSWRLISRNMNKLNEMTAYFQESGFPYQTKPNSSHPASIAVVIASNANFLVFKLGTNWVKMIHIISPKSTRKKT